MKRLLLILLNRQRKVWEKELDIARFEFDMCCNLSDDYIKKLIEVKNTRPEYIGLIDKLKGVL
jgi:hypothetical protein